MASPIASSVLALASVTCLVVATPARSPAPYDGDTCSECQIVMFQSSDQAVDLPTNASVSIAIAPVNNGTCYFDDVRCSESTPCVVTWSEIVNVGTSGGTVGYSLDETDGAGVTITATGSRQSVPPGGGGPPVNATKQLSCDVSFVYSVTILTGTGVALGAQVSAGCSPCALL